MKCEMEKKLVLNENYEIWHKQTTQKPKIK